MDIDGPLTGVAAGCERVLGTLPEWFGIEDALLEYAQNTARLPTFVARDGPAIVGFLSLREHFPESWEVDCVAVDRRYRGRGLGRRLQRSAEQWLVDAGAMLLQVKTLAASHPSEAYAQTRGFYRALGYTPVEVFPALWAPHLPVLQLVKVLRRAG